LPTPFLAYKDFAKGADRGKMKDILLVKGRSKYGRIESYIDEIAASIRKIGYNTCVLDGWSLAQPMHYNHILAQHQFDLVLDVNGTCFDYGILKNLPPTTIYGVYICDPPKALDERIKQADGRTVIFACDNRFHQYMEQLYPMVEHSAFVPLSGSFYPECPTYKDRGIDVIFTGSYRLPDELKAQALGRFEASGVMAQFVRDMLEDIITNSEYTLPQCLLRALNKYNQPVDAEEFDELVGEFMAGGFYARFYYRDKLIRTLLSAGIEVHVFGDGWEAFQSEHKGNLRIHKGGAYAASKALANAKIALNIMPWFKDGFQERIASAMLSKAIAVTDESQYILDNFEDNKELVIYSLKDIDTLAERIKYLLAHPNEAANIAELGYQKAQSHTWENRVCDMLRIVEEKFGVSTIVEGEGKQLEFEIGYPDAKSTFLDALYEFQNMVALIEGDMEPMEQVSKADVEFLIKKYDNLTQRFSKKIDGLELKGYIKECIDNLDINLPTHFMELFSLHCKACMSELLLKETGLKV